MAIQVKHITRCRPGSTSARGAGVDGKHGSYARYLAKLKGKTWHSNKTVGIKNRK